MLTNHRAKLTTPQKGVSLVELIVFIVVISVALAGLLGVYQIAVVNSADPVKRLRMLECAQERLDQVIALRYEDVIDTSDPGLACYSPTLIVNADPPDFEGEERKLVTVTVKAGGEELTLSAYRVNF